MPSPLRSAVRVAQSRNFCNPKQRVGWLWTSRNDTQVCEFTDISPWSTWNFTENLKMKSYFDEHMSGFLFLAFLVGWRVFRHRFWRTLCTYWNRIVLSKKCNCVWNFMENPKISSKHFEHKLTVVYSGDNKELEYSNNRNSSLCSNYLGHMSISCSCTNQLGYGRHKTHNSCVCNTIKSLTITKHLIPQFDVLSRGTRQA